MIHIYYNCKPFLFSSNLTKTLMKPLAERPPVSYFLNLSVLFNYSVIVQSGWLSILLDPLNLAPSLSLSPLSLSLLFFVASQGAHPGQNFLGYIYRERKSQVHPRFGTDFFWTNFWNIFFRDNFLDTFSRDLGAWFLAAELHLTLLPRVLHQTFPPDPIFRPPRIIESVFDFIFIIFFSKFL